MKKRHWVIFVLGICLLMIFTPIFVNALMFINVGEIAGNQNTWIGFLGSLYGAIMGGVISGVLTLYGVILTIRRQREIDFDNRYPELVLNLKQIKDQLNNFFSVVSEVINQENPKKHYTESYIGKIQAIEKKCEGLIKKSVSINADTYLNTVEFSKIVEKHYSNIRKRMTYTDYGEAVYPMDDKSVQEVLFSMVKIIEIHDQIEKELSDDFYSRRKRKYTERKTFHD